MFVTISFTNVYQCAVVFLCGRYQSSFCQNWSYLRQNYALINCFAFEKNSEFTILWELNFFQLYSPFASILWECFRSWCAGRLPYWRFMLRLDVKQLIPCFDMVKKKRVSYCRFLIEERISRYCYSFFILFSYQQSKDNVLRHSTHVEIFVRICMQYVFDKCVVSAISASVWRRSFWRYSDKMFCEIEGRSKRSSSSVDSWPSLKRPCYP